MSVKKQLYLALVMLGVVLAIGVTGYILISGDTFIDALYMTVITISTVGFGLIHPLTPEGKIFTIFLIALSVFLYAYILKVVSESIANGTLFKELKFNKMQKRIDALNDHIIVCGYGRNGKQALGKLRSFDQQCVVIEHMDEKLEELGETELLHIKGNATEDHVLDIAGVKRAKFLIATLPSDADNLFIVLSARQLNKDLTIISRASSEETVKKLKIAGADNVIMPDKLGGEHMASLVVTPDIIEFVDELSLEGEFATNLQEIFVDEMPKRYLNQSIRDIDLRRLTGCSIIGFKTPENEYIVNPDGETKLIENSKLIVLGQANQIKKLKELF